MTQNEATGEITIAQDDLSGADIRALLEYHLAQMAAHSPICSVHAFPVERLRAPDVTFYALRVSDRLAGCGALKQIDAGHGELKSMRTDPAFVRRGLGEAMLLHLIAEARARGYTRLSLETGLPEPFHPAHALYRKHGFERCAPFGDYFEDPFSMCMTRML
ncbi:GNAT family N-acetyltransferase [Blastomonas sp.]|uniref:GNAT family N-acetyltransferase n=1 Tax=Blastomonas sp. TaxID=1909299 RepID=UPI00262481B6|nr:GNAT family N-acetyltransferase [Blastomonas sp.]MDM7957368.1 GNAT family N-acetyltransferase [Blastomonas sp.]